MKKLFWLSVISLILFEFLNVYFIMPMPGSSQQINSIDLAYFLYRWRWAFRTGLIFFIALGWYKSAWHKWWVPIFPILLAVAAIYEANFDMAADHIFYQPKHFTLKDTGANQVDSNRLILGVEHNGVSKAYPIRFMGFHHQVLDTIGGKAILVTYCTVCRTGRVYEPVINGKQETFRLVGMDHFNAMLEDATTHSWWRQATGEAIAGPLKGKQLPEVLSTQASLSEWIRLHPHTLIMQADSTYIEQFSKTTDYETGKSRKKLTGTDSLSWQTKSWVVGIKAGNNTKAYDWNQLKKEHIIQDVIQGIPVLIVMDRDTVGFFAFERPDSTSKFMLDNNILTLNNHHFEINGKGIDTVMNLKSLRAYQEFWHSWRTFQPKTAR